MKLPRHAGAFRQSLIEPGTDDFRNLLHAQPVDRPRDQGCDDDTEQPEPGGLEPGRRDAEFQSCSFFVPQPVIVASHHPKPVISWTEVSIERLAPGSSLLPAGIATLQFVTKAHFLRGHETQCRVINFEVSREPGETKFLLR